MNENRIALLERYQKESPEDPFFTYGLALEYAEDDPVQSIALLEECRIRFPTYLPLYYQLGASLLKHQRPEQAELVIEQGIELAQMQRDTKTLLELRSLLNDV